MANGNPFYVQPALSTAGGQRALAGLGNFLQDRRAEQQAQDQAAEAQQAFQQAYQSGSPADVAAVSAKYPQLSRTLMSSIQFRDDQTRQNLIDSARDITAGANPRDVINRRIQMVTAQGGDPTETMQELTRLDQLGEQGYRDYISKTYAALDPQGFKAIQTSTTGPEKTAGQREFAELTETAGLGEEEKALAAKIKLGLVPRATGSAEQTIASQGTAQSVAQVASVIEGGKTQGKLMAQLGLEPQVKSAVQAATLEAQAQAKTLANQKSNDSAWNVYQTGLSNLSESLGETATGPIAGLLPALTANAQSADGAVAIMAPLLKQAFRSAGEGTFTDKDQELLLAMVPTRRDLPEARKSKLEAIDSIMRAKLQQPEQDAPQQAAPEAARTEADILAQYGVN